MPIRARWVAQMWMLFMETGDVLSVQGRRAAAPANQLIDCDHKHHITPFPGPRSIVLLDNASIHRSVRFVEAVNACGGMVLFLPPYCWDLSPLDNNAFGSKRKLVWLDGRAEERMYVRRPHNSGRGVGSADAAARQSMWSDSSGERHA